MHPEGHHYLLQHVNGDVVDWLPAETTLHSDCIGDGFCHGSCVGCQNGGAPGLLAAGLLAHKISLTLCVDVNLAMEGCCDVSTAPRVSSVVRFLV